MSDTFGLGYFVKIIELQVCPGKSTPREHFVENNFFMSPFLKSEIAFPVLSSSCNSLIFSCEIACLIENFDFSSSVGRSWNAFICIKEGLGDFDIVSSSDLR